MQDGDVFDVLVNWFVNVFDFQMVKRVMVVIMIMMTATPLYIMIKI